MNALVDKESEKPASMETIENSDPATSGCGRCQPHGQNHQVRMRKNVGDAFKSVSMRNVSRRVFDMGGLWLLIEYRLCCYAYRARSDLDSQMCCCIFFLCNSFSSRLPR